MAKATEHYTPQEVMVVKNVRTITLELTEDEASAIHELVSTLCSAGGVTVTSPIYKALDNLRIKRRYVFEKGGNGHPYLRNL
jgi:hypothetical protein